MPKSGYTLIEILVGITIIALIFGFGYVSFREFSRRQALAGAVKEIKGDLRLAQALALSGGKPAGCSGFLKGFGFRVESTSSYKIEASCMNIVEDKTVNLPTGISISTPSPNPVLFKVLGQGTNIPSGGSAVITLTQAGTGSTLVVTITDGGEIK